MQRILQYYKDKLRSNYVKFIDVPPENYAYKLELPASRIQNSWTFPLSL